MSQASSAGSRPSAVVFVDTNILLHAPPLERISWSSLCDAEAVTLVVCVEVLDEVDHKKYDSRLGKRAKHAMQRLHQYLETGTCGEKATLMLFPNVLEHEEEATLLAGLRADAKIVLRAKRFQAHHPENYVCVATNDLGMRLRCQLHGIPFLDGEGFAQAIVGEDSSNEARTVVERSAVRPILSVQLTGQQKMTEPTATACFFTFPDEGHVNADDAIRSEADALHKQSAKAPMSVGDTAIKEYLDAYRAYVDRCNQRADARARQCLFTLELLNNGTAPATDIDLSLEFPEEVIWVGTEDDKLARFLNEEPKPPLRPKPRMPWEILDIGQTMAERLNAYGQGFSFARNDGLECVAEQKDDGRYVCHIHCDRLKHGSTRTLNLNAVFRSREAVQPHQLIYTLSASEILKAEEGTLHFIVRLPVQASHSHIPVD
jgi:hypothetical protein